VRYIGTSLGRCLRSILLGEVSLDQVFLICTGTLSKTKEQYLTVVNNYYHERPVGYDLTPWPLEEVEKLAVTLWDTGKIHQPRNFGALPFFPATHGDSILWFEIVPPHMLDRPGIKDLWEKVRMLVRLYE
jgi:hypothetical protein